MNRDHQCVCAGDEWRGVVRDFIIPWVLDGVDLGDDVLELGPGYGATTDVLRERLPRLTAVEIDAQLTAALASRFTNTNVEVVEGDASALDFGDRRFSGAASFSMLHHVHSPALQDRVFSEARRVLRPGGVFVASDSLDSAELRAFHHDDTYVPVDPATLAERLDTAGFTDVEIDLNEYAWKAIAR